LLEWKHECPEVGDLACVSTAAVEVRFHFAWTRPTCPQDLRRKLTRLHKSLKYGLRAAQFALLIVDFR